MQKKVGSRIVERRGVERKWPTLKGDIRVEADEKAAEQTARYAKMHIEQLVVNALQVNQTNKLKHSIDSAPGQYLATKIARK